MARPQNSPRGNNGSKTVMVGAAALTGDSTGNLALSVGLKPNGRGKITTDSTGNVILSNGLKLSNAALLLTANTTAVIWGNPEAAKPTTANGAAITLVSNSTGVALAINVGTTTWKYLSTTSVQPT